MTKQLLWLRATSTLGCKLGHLGRNFEIKRATWAGTAGSGTGFFPQPGFGNVAGSNPALLPPGPASTLGGLNDHRAQQHETFKLQPLQC